MNINKNGIWWTRTTAILLVGMLVSGVAQAINADAKLVMNEKIAIPLCGTDTFVQTVKLRVTPKLKWRVFTKDHGLLFGKYRQKFGGRLLKFDFSSPSRRRFIRSTEGWISEVCEAKVKIDKVHKIKIIGRLNKKKTRMTTLMTALFSGHTSQGSGSAKFTAVFKGPFVER